MQCIIGIDIGTTHTKAVVASGEAKVIAGFRETYAAWQPQPGWHEQDADEIFRAVMSVLQQAVTAIPAGYKLTCVSFSSAMHSLLAVDVHGQPLTALMTWADTRSEAYAKQLKHSPAAAAIYRQTGVPAHAMSPLCKIAWLRNEKPSLFAATHKFISIKEYVFSRLFGAFVVDYSVASATGLFDIHQLQWSDEALQFAGITAAQLSMPVPPLHRVGALKEAFQKQLNIGSETAFIAGASDGALATIGAGAVLPGEAALTIGTSGAIRALHGKPVYDEAGRLFNYAVDGQHYLAGGATNNGGNLLKWFIETFTDHAVPFETAIEKWLSKAADVAPGAEGLLFLPYVYGERAPVWDASASGIFMGIRAMHTKAHFLRALLEGVAFSLKQILQAMEENGTRVDTVYASGGFIESELWLQIVTDVLQKKVKLSREADASAMGAVFTGMQASGLLGQWEQVKSLRAASEELTPSPGSGEIYAGPYQRFGRLYEKEQEA